MTLANSINKCTVQSTVRTLILPVCTSIGKKAGEDGISVAKVAMLNKLEKAMSHPNKFGYLTTVMKGAVYEHMARLSIVHIPRSTHNKYGDSVETVEYHAQGVSTSHTDHMLQSELKELLSDTDFEIIICKVYGMTEHEIAPRIGLSRSGVHKRMIAIRKKVKRYIS